MRLFARSALILLALATGAWAADAPPGLHYKAVLVAGDWSAAAFDHATEAMQQRLLAGPVAPTDLQRLSAARARSGGMGLVIHSGSCAGSDRALVASGPTSGVCFVFATSHGAFEEGLVLVPSQDFLTPTALDRALEIGCGNAPTVAIISSCFCKAVLPSRQWRVTTGSS